MLSNLTKTIFFIYWIQFFSFLSRFYLVILSLFYLSTVCSHGNVSVSVGYWQQNRPLIRFAFISFHTDCGSKLVPSAQHQLLLTGENGGKGRGESTLNASAAYKYASCGSRPPVFSPMPGAVDKDSVLQACQKVVYVPDNSTMTSQLAPSSSSLLCNKKYVNEWYV